MTSSGVYQYPVLITCPVLCQTAWHANRTLTFSGRYGRMVGAACVDGGRSRTSFARELCGRERWHDTAGKPSPGSARGIPDRLADRVGVSPYPAAAVPFGDGVARPADGWPDTDLACSLADPGEVGLDPVSDADGRGRESMMESHHPEGRRRAPGLSSAHCNNRCRMCHALSTFSVPGMYGRVFGMTYPSHSFRPPGSGWAFRGWNPARPATPMTNSPMRRSSAVPGCRSPMRAPDVGTRNHSPVDHRAPAQPTTSRTVSGSGSPRETVSIQPGGSFPAGGSGSVTERLT